ncbi:hypothetical protein [Olsenella sp. An293]|uniref:hypothetical protein n=1 Tax=Olsenella sp. An293 TaxID=1965626 RepID=UPI000B39F1B5|nr:hypothetical protein [Olsenella sp. An293]OUO32241.1 hypothetical protein B5F85_06805 [Olsenella sp. An293]
MALTGTEPVSADNLAAALDAGGGASDTGGKPVSVDNLAAALEAKEASSSIAILYEGPAVTEATLSRSANDYDLLMVDVFSVYGGVPYYSMLVQSKYAGNSPEYYVGGMYYYKKNPPGNVGNETSTQAKLSSDGMTLTIDWNQDKVQRVIGMNLKLQG